MDTAKGPPFKLFSTSAVENRDELEEKFERGYTALQALINGLNEKEAATALNSAALKEKTHEELTSGLIYSILTDPTNASKHYRDLTLTSRDGLASVIVILSQLVLEKYLRITEQSRSQLMWLLREMIRTGIANVDTLVWNVLRHAAGGDVSPRNIALVEGLLDLFTEQRTWLFKFPVLVASVVYAYLRLIEDHTSPNLSALRQREVTFVVGLLRERFSDCLVIGRDLVRLLQNIARIPEVEAFWRDLLHNPKSLAPNFTGILQLLQTRTSRRFLQSRLTPDMERKLVFLTGQVRFGNHKRYQEWFQRQYLMTAESQSLRCDLIRFIVGVIHPTNELLCSDIIPRWAVIGWLITTCTSGVTASNAKLALFYDWLFYDQEKDNIMNIEPAILVMHNSMRTHPSVTATLLDFLCRIIPNFHPMLVERVRAGIYTSLRQILEKRVLPSLYPLFNNPKLDRELKLLVKDTFREFCIPSGQDCKMEEMGPATGLANAIKEDNSLDPNFLDSSIEPLPNSEQTSPTEDEPAFSDDDMEEDDIKEEKDIKDLIPFSTPINANSLPPVPRISCEEEDDDDIPLAKVRLKEKPPLIPVDSSDNVNSGDLTRDLEGDLKEAAQTLISSLHCDSFQRCEALEHFFELVTEEDQILDHPALTDLVSCLIYFLPELNPINSPEPMNIESKTVEEAFEQPLLNLLSNINRTAEESSRKRSRSPLLQVVVQLAIERPRLGYLFLYFVTLSKKNGNKMSAYKEFCTASGRDLQTAILLDLKCCQEEDVPLFCFLIPEIYANFPSISIGNSTLVKLIVSTVDASQLQQLICLILQGQLTMFHKGPSFLSMLTLSLSWETFEQFCFWQLISAHGIPIETLVSILPGLDFTNHAEALTTLLLLLKNERPSIEIIKCILTREVTPPQDQFVISTLKNWCHEYEEKLSELIASILTSRYPSPASTSPTKRKRGSGGSAGKQAAAAAAAALAAAPPTAEQVLGHLDQLRQSCRFNNFHLYNSDVMQRALQAAYQASSETLRKKFAELFALVADDEPTQGKGKTSAVNRRKGANSVKGKPRSIMKLTDSSEEISEDEEIVKPRPSKKRKKMNQLGSDSE